LGVENFSSFKPAHLSSLTLAAFQQESFTCYMQWQVAFLSKSLCSTLSSSFWC